MLVQYGYATMSVMAPGVRVQEMFPSTSHVYMREMMEGAHAHDKKWDVEDSEQELTK